MESNFKCTQQELYATCRLAWSMCQDNLTEFAAFKGKYTADFIAQNVADIQAADAMPNEMARKALHSTERLKLIAIKDDIIKAFKRLKSYINDAFPASERTIMYNAAGQAYLIKATENSWQHVSALLSAATTFIETYKTQLKGVNNDNMPQSFADLFMQLKTAYEAQDIEFTNAEAAASKMSDDKTMANNALYTSVIAMFSDAQSIFVGNSLMMKAFTFTAVLSKTRGVKPAGIGGKVTLDDGITPLENVVVILDNGAKMTVTDNQGRYLLQPVATGKYTVVFECPGFEPVVVDNHEVKTGIVGRLNVVMTIAVAKTIDNIN